VGRYTLWCLNRAANYDQDRLRSALADLRHGVRLGERAPFDGPGAGPNATPLGVLMHERPDCDEYFVPIAVKCVGDPARFRERYDHQMGRLGRARFEQLLAGFSGFFASGAARARAYWDGFPNVTALASVKMFTRRHIGFYEVLAEDARANGAPAVLVGYSQGGVVARFLAWMDEYLMAPPHRAIRGVITVQSPNHGSPLADRRNVDNAGTGLLGALFGLLEYAVVDGHNPHLGAALHALAFGRLGRAGADPFHFGVGAVAALLDEAVLDTDERRRRRGAAAPESARDRHKIDLLRTCRKWLTGLAPEETATAFGDLDPAGLDVPSTVLGRLVESPPREIFHGAVVGSNSSVQDLALQELPFYERWAIRHFVGAERFGDVQSAYTRISLDEEADASSYPRTPRHAELARLYRLGLDSAGFAPELPPFAHDFVQPSVSQALHVLDRSAPHPRFLGNRLNASATHISGGRRRGRGSDAGHVRRLLAQLGRRLD
jgi:hypothetical protein